MVHFIPYFIPLFKNMYRVPSEQETELNAVERTEMIQSLIRGGLSNRTHCSLDEREDR